MHQLLLVGKIDAVVQSLCCNSRSRYSLNYRCSSVTKTQQQHQSSRRVRLRNRHTIWCENYPGVHGSFQNHWRAIAKCDKDVLLATKVLLFQLWEEVPVNVHAWHRLCFAQQGWQTNRCSNAEARVNTRQTGCQHRGLITVSISPVSVIPWHSSLLEILFHTRVFLAFMYSVIPVINVVQVVIHAERHLNSVVSWCSWHIEIIPFAYCINATLSTVLLHYAAFVFTLNAQVNWF